MPPADEPVPCLGEYYENQSLERAKPMCNPNQMRKFSDSDFDKVTREGGKLTISLPDAEADEFGLREAAHYLGDACELMSGQVNLPDGQIIAAKKDFDITVVMRVTPNSMITSNDCVGSSRSDVARVMSEGGMLTFHLTKGFMNGFSAAAYDLGEMFADRGHVFEGAIHMLRENFDFTVEVRLSAKTK
ncbi:hypothetical protein ACQPZP_25420 [Spirillospora sp. CA-142024]|uniref:hypothetical protein n=1 Tax=Spirillospora sp. CA-142024 TaxID=3240036 RepID=UPI003D8ADA43